MQLQSKDSQKLPETRKRQGGASPESSEGTGPVHTLILYLAPAELWENKFLLFEVTQIATLRPNTLRSFWIMLVKRSGHSKTVQMLRNPGHGTLNSSSVGRRKEGSPGNQHTATRDGIILWTLDYKIRATNESMDLRNMLEGKDFSNLLIFSTNTSTYKHRTTEPSLLILQIAEPQ